MANFQCRREQQSWKCTARTNGDICSLMSTAVGDFFSAFIQLQSRLPETETIRATNIARRLTSRHLTSLLKFLAFSLLCFAFSPFFIEPRRYGILSTVRLRQFTRLADPLVQMFYHKAIHSWISLWLSVTSTCIRCLNNPRQSGFLWWMSESHQGQKKIRESIFQASSKQVW